MTLININLKIHAVHHGITICSQPGMETSHQLKAHQQQGLEAMLRAISQGGSPIGTSKGLNVSRQLIVQLLVKSGNSYFKSTAAPASPALPLQ